MQWAGLDVRAEVALRRKHPLSSCNTCIHIQKHPEHYRQETPGSDRQLQTLGRSDCQFPEGFYTPADFSPEVVGHNCSEGKKSKTRVDLK